MHTMQQVLTDRSPYHRISRTTGLLLPSPTTAAACPESSWKKDFSARFRQQRNKVWALVFTIAKQLSMRTAESLTSKARKAKEQPSKYYSLSKRAKRIELRKPKLLIIDDDEDLRTQMKWALVNEYDVALAEDRPSAVAAMHKDQPMIVTLDLGLPPL